MDGSSAVWKDTQREWITALYVRRDILPDGPAYGYPEDCPLGQQARCPPLDENGSLWSHDVKWALQHANTWAQKSIQQANALETNPHGEGEINGSGLSGKGITAIPQPPVPPHIPRLSQASPFMSFDSSCYIAAAIRMLTVFQAATRDCGPSIRPPGLVAKHVLATMWLDIAKQVQSTGVGITGNPKSPGDAATLFHELLKSVFPPTGPKTTPHHGWSLPIRQPDSAFPQTPGQWDLQAHVDFAYKYADMHFVYPNQAPKQVQPDTITITLQRQEQ
jgi:hypothetical protein